MRFAFGDDVDALRDGVASYLAKECPPEVVQAAWLAGGMGGARALWSGLAGMGVLGMLAPEEAGGLGLDEVALAVVLAEAGRVAAPLPLVETAAIAVPLLTAAGDPPGILAGVVAGEVVVSVASGPVASGRVGAGRVAAGRVGAGRDAGGNRSPVASDGDGPLAAAGSDADWFLVLGGPGAPAVLHPRREVELVALPSVDRTRDLARVIPRGTGTPLVARGPVGASELGRVGADLGALGAAAQLIGLARGLLEITVDYVQGRQQFGAPVGSFQAVKHRLADALLGVELAAPTVWAAAHAVARGDGDATRAVSLAKAMASDAARACARTALQCHGAIGYTDDYHLHLWLKRTWCLAGAYGSAAWHRDRIGRSLGL